MNAIQRCKDCGTVIVESTEWLPVGMSVLVRECVKCGWKEYPTMDAFIADLQKLIDESGVNSATVEG